MIWRHPDALHLPWLTFGQAMWGANNGLTAPRGKLAYNEYKRAMADAGVASLDAMQVSEARTDASHDGLHYFHRRSRSGGENNALYSNSVGLVVLQLLLHSICAADDPA